MKWRWLAHSTNHILSNLSIEWIRVTHLRGVIFSWFYTIPLRIITQTTHTDRGALNFMQISVCFGCCWITTMLKKRILLLSVVVSFSSGTPFLPFYHWEFHFFSVFELEIEIEREIYGKKWEERHDSQWTCLIAFLTLEMRQFDCKFCMYTREFGPLIITVTHFIVVGTQTLPDDWISSVISGNLFS